ncbi:VOC family protein [Oryzobacter terrae]|uniref:VOC family protein n=1 Tax=Oryzobacter terrae TaxID=1620385 RepID=UPI00367017A1
MEPLTYADVLAARLDDWRVLAQGLHARYRSPDVSSGAAFVAAAVGAAGPHADHLDLTLGHRSVVVRAATRHDRGLWVTADDVAAAHAVTEVARGHGLTPEPHLLAQLELGLDTWSTPEQSRFWAAVLTGDADHHREEGDIVDLAPGLPHVWFQDTDAHDEPRQRWHWDLWLAPEVAAERIAAAVAAGGTVVHDSEAPSFTVLADPEGNKVCICTALDRDGGPEDREA